jgi:glutamine amidotransferase
MIAIIDYGMGNLFSIYKALRKVGGDSFIISNSSELKDVDGVVIPGVGSFGDGMHNLRPFSEKVLDLSVPILGICLGMQVFFKESEEGMEKGLGMIEGRVIRLPSSVRIPQMGWNSLEIKKRTELLHGIEDGDFFYFAHSYHCVPSENGEIVAITKHGTDIAAVVEKDNIYAVQFHPEKSGGKGLKILRNFVDLLS